MPALVSTLQATAATHDVSPLLRYLLPHLIGAVFAGCSGENMTCTCEDFVWREDDRMNIRQHFVYLLLSVSGETDELAVLTSILQSVPLTGSLDQTVAR